MVLALAGISESCFIFILCFWSGDFPSLCVRVEETEESWSGSACSRRRCWKDSSAISTPSHLFKGRVTETVSCLLAGCLNTVNLITLAVIWFPSKSAGRHVVSACWYFTTWVKGRQPQTDGVWGFIQWVQLWRQSVKSCQVLNQDSMLWKALEYLKRVYFMVIVGYTKSFPVYGVLQLVRFPPWLCVSGLHSEQRCAFTPHLSPLI